MLNESFKLDCRAASAAERAKAFENVFDVWRHAETKEEHVKMRSASPQHSRAKWFVGCLGKRVVTSLGCYPMTFSLGGRVVKGFAIGAVHTVSEYRGRGFAAGLLDWVENHEADAGAQIALLFSDIAPEFYERLGYTLCPALEGWTRTDRAHLPSEFDWNLAPCSAQSELPGLMKTYDSHHSALAFSILRDHSYWSYLLRKGASYETYWLMDGDTRRQGYVTLSTSGSRMSIQDFAVAEARFPQFIAAVQRHAQTKGISSVVGWLPEATAFAEAFSLTPRKKEITMIKCLGGNQKIDLEMQQAAGRIHEIDHV